MTHTPPEVQGRPTVFFDGGCGLCSSTEARWRNWFAAHGFNTAFLQENTAIALPPELRTDPRGLILLTTDGKIRIGVDALTEIAGVVWWGRPLRFLANLPVLHIITRWIYAVIAKHRLRISQSCGLKPAINHSRTASQTNPPPTLPLD